MSCSSKRNREVGSCISTLVSSTNSLDTPSLSAVRLVVDLARDSSTLGGATRFLSAGLLPVILACGCCGCFCCGDLAAGVTGATAATEATGDGAGAASTNAIWGLTVLPRSALG